VTVNKCQFHAVTPVTCPLWKNSAHTIYSWKLDGMRYPKSFQPFQPTQTHLRSRELIAYVGLLIVPLRPHVGFVQNRIENLGVERGTPKPGLSHGTLD
jgi:hypothetical protein